MKRCSKCCQDRTLDDFGVDRSRSDGLQVWCKSCQRDYRRCNREKKAEKDRAWKQANPGKVKASRQRRRSRPEVQASRAAYNKAWKRANPDKVKAHQRGHYLKNAERYRKAAQDWVAANPDKVKANGERYREKNAEEIRAYRKANRHRDRAYYAENAEAIRLKKEAKRRWVVYLISFVDGTYYVGSSCQHEARFNFHKSAAARGIHVGPLNGRDFESAQLVVLEECPDEVQALTQEAFYVMAFKEDARCLNQLTPELPKKLFWVYVVQSENPRTGKRGQILPGFFYVGMTTDPALRLRQHNGLYADGTPGLKGGGRYTSKHRPWRARSLHGPYLTRSEALRAEYALKRQKRGTGRLQWKSSDSPWCWGPGVDHPWVQDESWRPPTPEEWRLGHVVEPT